MKILQVVTYRSQDGAFGGPTRVAEAQCKALAKLGHEVILLAASPIKTPSIEHIDGYKIVLVPARRVHKKLGFAGVFAPALSSEVKRALEQADVAHVHMARDLVTLPAAHQILRNGTPLFLQTHGMIDASNKWLARPVDFFLTKPILAKARRIFTLTDQEDLDITQIVASARIERIKNGVEIRDLPPYENRPDKVVFLSRLQARKRPVAFVEMAAVVLKARPDLTFEIAGSDEGEIEAVNEAITKLGLQNKLKVVGAIHPLETDSFLESAKVMVLPSFGEIFPMVLLEAFSAGTPAVVTDSLGMVQDCIDYGLAEVTNGDPVQLAQAVLDIFEKKGRAQDLRTNGRSFLKENLNVEDVASGLLLSYKSSVRD